MSITFPRKDELHNVDVRFSRACLPEAKKPYYLKPAHQKELDISAVAGKADAYKVSTDSDTIEEGFTAAMELMFYLTADGYRIKTQYFTMQLKVPGEYDGTEESMPDGVTAKLRLRTTALARNYIRDKVRFEINGMIEHEGIILNVLDELTGRTNETATRGNILTIRGRGLKINAETDKKDLAGVYFMPADGSALIKAEVIAVNQPRTLKVVVPTTLTVGASYVLAVETQSAVTSGARLLKEMRDVRSDFTVIAQ